MLKPYVPCELPLPGLDYNSFVRALSEANRNIARYDGLLNSIPNKYVFLSPFITEEAVLSSIIEGTQATFQEVLEFEADESRHKDKRDDILEVKNYRVAMEHAVQRCKEIPICLRLIKELHKILMNSVRGMNKSPGEFRKIQNWIGRPGSSIEEATFIPPSPANLSDYLGNLEKYINYNDKDYIVQAAIIHAQFELIHPFLDGNGRIGRMFIPLFLFIKGVMSDPVFYISSYFEENQEEYYYYLSQISKQQDWNGWILFFITAINEQSARNINKIKTMLGLYEDYKKRINKVVNSSRNIIILDNLFKVPIFKATQFSEVSGIPQKTVDRYIKQLVDLGILTTNEKGKQRTYFFNDLLDILK